MSGLTTCSSGFFVPAPREFARAARRRRVTRGGVDGSQRLGWLEMHGGERRLMYPLTLDLEFVASGVYEQ